MTNVKMKKYILIVALLLLIQSAYASTIEGNVYDFSLKKISAKITINTQPRQQFIAQNGSYVFTASKGTYTITAEQLDKGKSIAAVQENITIPEQGTFHIDLIVFPDFEQEQDLIDTDITVEDITIEDTTKLTTIAALVAGIAIIVIMVMRARRIHNRFKQQIKEAESQKMMTETKNNELPKDLQELLNFIRTAGGRTTQKDVRKQFPQSEAKISLMIADLEQRNLIQKIRKGRGNILILNEKS